jgi:hypothetical protein
MRILVLGGTGATGRLLIRDLLERGHYVRTIVRSVERLPEDLRDHKNLEIKQAPLLELSNGEMIDQVKDCDAIASTLGHNVTFKGIYGRPRRLVADAARRMCSAVKANDPDHKIKYVLMNTVGNRNRDLNEPISIAQRILIVLFRLLLPPHVDNEKAADYLRVEIGQYDPVIEWSAVRPDTLIDDDRVTPYELHPSPTTSIFKPRKTSRINVAHFMAELIADQSLWEEWKGRMPVIYNRESA